MKRCRFDPFADRLARDMRNGLSTAFIVSLDERTPAPFRDVVRSYLQQNLAPPYREYVEDRSSRYEEALSAILTGEIHDPFAQTIVLWNKGLLFEVHERLEGFWRDLPDDARKAVKGIIQAVAAYLHQQNGNDQAAESLAKRAAGLLAVHGKALPPFVRLDEVIDRLARLDFEPPLLG